MSQLTLNRVFGALADPTRRAVLAALRESEAPVHEIAARFDISRPGVSKHLAVLRQAGLVRERRRGRENVYAINQDALADARGWLAAFWKGRLTKLKQLVENRMSEPEKLPPIRKTVIIDAGIDKVWRTMTSVHTVPSWLGCLRYEARVGAIFFMQQDQTKARISDVTGATHRARSADALSFLVVRPRLSRDLH